MSNTIINLGEIEKKAWKTYYQDGLWDLFLGMLLLMMGSGSFLYEWGLSELMVYLIMLLMAALIVGAFYAAKRLITVPRLGRVKFGEKGKARKKKATIVYAASVLFGLVVFIAFSLLYKSSAQLNMIAIIFPTVYALNMLVVFGLGAYFLNFNRLYLIAVMYALPIPVQILVDELIGIKLGYIIFIVPSAIILIVGLVVFVRFLKQYPPVKAEEVSNDTL